MSRNYTWFQLDSGTNQFKSREICSRYITHFYCLAVVECLPLDPAAQVRFPPRTVGIFLHPVTFNFFKKKKKKKKTSCGRSRLLQRRSKVFAFRSCGPGSIPTSGGWNFSGSSSSVGHGKPTNGNIMFRCKSFGLE